MAQGLIYISDNNVNGKLIDNPTDVDNLSCFVGKKIKQLVNEENLLIFPYSLSEYGDELGEQSIGSLQVIDKQTRLCTGNVMGFVGKGDTQLRIYSRFGNEKDDFFLYYMLCRVLSINIFDLPYSQGVNSSLDMLLLLFPYYLSKAMEQGLYKEYCTNRNNDANVRGVIDINRHIQKNIPFKGSVAYNNRERTADNMLTQLVRHTIEYIRQQPMGAAVLERDNDIRAYVSMIIEATPSFSSRERMYVINQNLRPKIHPYYSEYRPLQQLCLQILRHEDISTGAESEQIFGILFDGAWLWEEYMDTILHPLNFEHPQNKVGKHKKYLFTDSSGIRYPDFYHPDTKVVLDAKYKCLETKSRVSEIDRDDIHQVISYMHILQSPQGGFLFPSTSSAESPTSTLHGYGGQMALYPLLIPVASDWSSFIQSMRNSEKNLVKHIPFS